MLLPDERYQRIFDIPLESLKDRGIRGLILDIDNTLTIHNSPNIDERTRKWLDRARELGFSLIILSNNTKKRVAPFANSIGIDFVFKGNKPLLSGARKCLEKLELSPKELGLIGDQIFTDVLCANRLGALSILLEPIENEKFIFFRLKRYFEKIILRRASSPAKL